MKFQSVFRLDYCEPQVAIRHVLKVSKSLQENVWKIYRYVSSTEQSNSKASFVLELDLFESFERVQVKWLTLGTNRVFSQNSDFSKLVTLKKNVKFLQKKIKIDYPVRANQTKSFVITQPIRWKIFAALNTGKNRTMLADHCLKRLIPCISNVGMRIILGIVLVEFLFSSNILGCSRNVSKLYQNL